MQAGVPAISFWAAVPHYVSQPPSPKATLALLHRVEEVLDVEVPLGALPEQAEEWERTVTEMADEDEDVRNYVRALEERGDAETEITEASRRRRSPPSSSATCAGAGVGLGGRRPAR